MPKIIGLITLIFIFIVPFFLVKFQKNKEKNVSIVTLPTLTPEIKPLNGEKNIFYVENLNSYTIEKEILEIVNLNNSFFYITADSIIDMNDNQIYLVPNDFYPIKTASEMDDLNLIFISNEKNKILSWSPISKKFQENQIILSRDSEISLMKTYLTYLYILDIKNSKIYRYPRSTGGFGESINWLKENVDLKNSSSFSISENIFITKDNQLYFFSKGKKEEFKIEKLKNEIKFDKVSIKVGYKNIYILDKSNSRIVKLDLFGNLISQYYNLEISSANAFSVNEENNSAYFSVRNNLKSFGMN